MTGRRLDGTPLALPLTRPGPPVLLLFLTSACDGCRDLWALAADPAAAGLDGVRVAVVARPGGGDPDGSELAALAPADAVVVRSPSAWADYAVSGPPFFVLVAGSPPRVATEGVAWGAGQVVGHVTAALGGEEGGAHRAG